MLMTSRKKTIALCLVLALLLPGCIGSDVEEEVVPIDDTVPEPEPEIVTVPQTLGCDNLNPIHCMLPFPSDAFLVTDNSTVTGVRVNYAESTLPDSGSMDNVNLPSLNILDGMSPSTQIMTAFSTVPNLTGVADQYSVELSLQDGHSTMLLNLDTGERLPHWVEIDARQTDSTRTIVFIRTMQSLDTNTAYGIGMADLGVNPSIAMQAMIEGVETNDAALESRRASMNELFSALESQGMNKSQLVSAWSFRTASMDSILGGMLSMRADALNKLGDDGINCTVTSVEDNWLGDDADHDFRLIKGTYTVPYYLQSQDEDIPSTMLRDAAGIPQFVDYAEIPFSMAIPQVLVNNNTTGKLTVFGHGFLGTGEAYLENRGILDYAQAYEIVLLATDISGWSTPDVGLIALGLSDPGYFEHQSDRLQQMLVNQMALARTFKGVCSDMDEMYHNNTNLVDTSDVNYMGISLGGIYGASITAFSPDIDRAALWVGGSGFSTFIERSTNYASFGDQFSLDNNYPKRNDRAVLIALCQHLWDRSDPEMWLRYVDGDSNENVDAYSILYIISVNDAQVPGISSDRAARIADIPVLDSSARLPWGVTTASGPITGSAIVYWDGGYDAMPDSNAPPPMADAGLAHNGILPIIQVNEQVEGFLSTGIINDTCNGTCVFDPDADAVELS